LIVFTTVPVSAGIAVIAPVIIPSDAAVWNTLVLAEASFACVLGAWIGVIAIAIVHA
jgi:hypothetical protein